MWPRGFGWLAINIMLGMNMIYKKGEDHWAIKKGGLWIVYYVNKSYEELGVL